MFETLTSGSLYSGIGGIDLGFEWAGIETTWQCETDWYCRRVLEKHWPGLQRYRDIHKLKRPPWVHILVGGFPCQPASHAGKRLGKADPRWLWPEFARLIDAVRPWYAVVENVPGLRTKGIDEVLSDLTCLGYDAEWQVISAASCGAPHVRERIFIVAYPQGDILRPGLRTDESAAIGRRRSRDGRGPRDVGNANGSRPQGRGRLIESPGEGSATEAGLQPRIFTRGPAPRWEPEPRLGRMAYGVSARVDRLRGLGNAVVPQVAGYIGSLIVDDYHRRAR
jgi:DNA (cytosine-5)-methyltransferase 1